MVIPPYVQVPLLRRTFEAIDGLVLSGGGDIHPSCFGETDSGLLRQVDQRRDRAELSLARWACQEGLPTLAICRGIQTVNVSAGGTLIQDIPTQNRDALSHSSVAGRPLRTVAHTVDVNPDSRLAHLIGAGEISVNSAHHQALKLVGDRLIVVARAPDGIIEGVEAPDHPFCIGVQWHPEVMVDHTSAMRRLFEGLIEAARV